MLLLGSDLDAGVNRHRSASVGGETRCEMENGGGREAKQHEDIVSALFDQFCHASTCKAIIGSFQQLCEQVGLAHADHRNFYRKLRVRINSWKAHALWVKLDKRASQKEYKRGEACANTKVIIIGGGVCGLRVAIETALLGARTVVVEKRDRFTRNNVLHLWPYLITDLKNLGAKKFFGKFCAGAIDHISIRQIQCILLKVALLVGVEIHLNVGFVDIIEPTCPETGWKVKVDPENHPVSEYEFDVLIGADGKRNTLDGYKRKEFRGKLAIAITANFINRNTQQEARVEEISGVAFIFNQKFFKDLYSATNIDLENIVYYKDETHYFVMTAKKQSLLLKGVLKQDFNDTAALLARDNVDQEALANYAREAADFSTSHMLPTLDFAVNHYGQADLAMFDFTSLFQSENASRVVERHGRKLLTMLVGDSLLEPFWPTGSGCARGFLGAFDGAWMVRNWSSGKMTTLQVLAERESIYQLLSQTTPDNLQKNYNQYTIDPKSRYSNVKIKWLKLNKVVHLYDTGESTLRDDIIEMPSKAKDDVIDTYSLLRWCQKILNTGKYHTINITDLSTSWRSGLAFCALIHYFKPEAIEYDKLNEEDIAQNAQLAFDAAQREFGLSPMLKGEDLAGSERPDKLTVVSYLSQFYDLFKKQRPPSEELLNSSFEEGRKHRSPSHRLSILQKIRSSRVSLSKLKKSIKKDKEVDLIYDDRHGPPASYQRPKLPSQNSNYNNNNNCKPDPNFVSHDKKFVPHNGNVELTRYNKLPMSEITTKLTEPNAKPDKDFKRREDMMPVVKVSKMAEILVSKFKSNQDQPVPDLARRVKGQPMMVASQPASEFCFFCKKRVYIMERMCVEGVFFHTQCFKCDFCGVGLRANTYTVDKTSYGDALRFFCARHALPTSRFGRPPRKRGVEETKDAVSKDNIPADTGPTPNKMPVQADSPKKTPAMLSPVSNTDDLNNSLKTPERIEFENTLDGGLPEEQSEEDQYEHNLSASMTRDGFIFPDVECCEDEEEEDSDDSDLEDLLSEMDPNEYEEVAQLLTVWSEDEEFQEAVDLYNSGRLEESLCLAKESLRKSTENLMEMQDMEVGDGYTRLHENDDADDDTEVEDSDEFETDDSDTELEDDNTETSTSRRTDTTSSVAPGDDNKPSPLKPAATPPTSLATQPAKPAQASSLVRRPAIIKKDPVVTKARVDFFNSPAEPVRLDPFKMFGMERKSGAPVKEEEPAVASPGMNGEVKVATGNSGLGEVESDEGTDRQVNSGVLDTKGQRESCNTDDDLDEAFVSAEYDLGDEEIVDKTAVSQAMEQLLADMDHKSESLSDSCEILKALTDDDLGEDDVFDVYRRQLSSKSSLGSRSGSDRAMDTWKSNKSSKSQSSSDVDKGVRSKRSSGDSKKSVESSRRRAERKHKKGAKLSETSSDLGDTEKSVLRSVRHMSDDPGSTPGSGQTTLEVMRSVNEINDKPVEDRIEKCIQYLDDKFVTRTRGHSHKTPKSRRSVHRSSSEESFTVSSASHSSRHTSSSSLSDEFEYNKQFVTGRGESDDERPDSDLMRDYQLTLSHALGEDSDEISPRDPAPIEGEDLDNTINAEDVAAASPRSEYLSPRSDFSDTSDRFVSPKSDRNSSVYETPESSLTEQGAKELEFVSPIAKVPEVDKSAEKKTIKKLSESKSDPTTLDSGQGGTKKKKSNGKAPKVIKQASLDSRDEIEMAARSSNTIIRPYRHGSREGSVEANPLERDAWGSSSSCNSQASVETAQKNWRPLPPVPSQETPTPKETTPPAPIESSSSPRQSKSVKQGTGRKLPDPAAMSKSPVVFQSNFMKKAYNTSSDASDDTKADTVKSADTTITQVPETSESVIVSQPRPLPVPPGSNKIGAPSSKLSKTPSKPIDKTDAKTKISVDFKKLVSNSDKDSGSDTDKKKKRIPVASALKKSLQPSVSVESHQSVEEEDIPFADDSDEEVHDKFFTPATSVKPKAKVHRADNGNKDVRKRILPTPPAADARVLAPDHIRDIKKAEREKAREEARVRARLKSDEELGLGDLGYTPGKARDRAASKEASCESSQSAATSATERVSDSDDVKPTLKKIAVSFTPDIPEDGVEPKSAKKKKKKSKERDSSSLSYSEENADQDYHPKKEKKKRSLIASLLGVKTPDKSKGIKEKDRSSSNDTLEDKPVKKKKTKTPKAEKKKKDKKRKTASLGAELDDSLLTENLKDLKIGSVFTEKSHKRPGLRGKIVPPKASVDDFTDSDDELSSMATSMTSLHEGHSRRIKSDYGPLSEEELNARITRKIQHAARKQQKQQEQRRLHQAQEIQRKLQEVDVKQRELEERGVVVERALRGEGPEAGRVEAELMQDWFNLVHEKNALVRLESEYMVSARELELEDRQGRLQQQLRESLSLDERGPSASHHHVRRCSGSFQHLMRKSNRDTLKSPLQREREQKIYNELIEVVEERDKLVAMLEEERVREREEDKDLENVMRAKGFSLSPTSGSKILRNTRQVKAS